MQRQSLDANENEPGGFSGGAGYGRTNGWPSFARDVDDGRSQPTTIRPPSSANANQRLFNGTVLTKRVLKVLSANVASTVSGHPVVKRKPMQSMRYRQRTDYDNCMMPQLIANTYDENFNPAGFSNVASGSGIINKNNSLYSNNEPGPSTSMSRPTARSANFATVDPNSISLFDDVEVKPQPLTYQNTQHTCVEIKSEPVFYHQDTAPRYSGFNYRSTNTTDGVMSPPLTPQSRVPQPDCMTQNEQLTMRAMFEQRRQVQNQELEFFEKPQTQRYRPSDDQQELGNSQYQNHRSPARLQVLRIPQKRYRSNESTGEFREPCVNRKASDKTLFTYYQVATICILNAPERNATVPEMYRFILKHFYCFEDKPKASWKASLRHALAKEEHFAKIEGKVSVSNGAYYKINDKVKESFVQGLWDTANVNINALEELRLNNPDNLHALLNGNAGFVCQPSINGNLKQTRQPRKKTSGKMTSASYMTSSSTTAGSSNMINQLEHYEEAVPPFYEHPARDYQGSMQYSERTPSAYSTSAPEAYNTVYGSEHSNESRPDSLSASISSSSSSAQPQPYSGVQDQSDIMAEFFIMQPTSEVVRENSNLTEAGGLGVVDEYINYDANGQVHDFTGVNHEEYFNGNRM